MGEYHRSCVLKASCCHECMRRGRFECLGWTLNLDEGTGREGVNVLLGFVPNVEKQGWELRPGSCGL